MPVKNKRPLRRIPTIRNRNQTIIDSLDPLFWSQEWEKALNTSSLFRRSVPYDRWIEYWSHISKGYEVRIQFESKIIEEIIRILFLEGVMSGESVVLDVGCGPGTFAIPFARRVNHVIALDPAIKMIDIVREKAQHQRFSNITFLCQRWEESYFSKECDLVFASFSPAIRDAESLLKMNQASRRYCCLITSSEEETFKIRNQLWERIFEEPFHSSSFHIIYPFNFLYASDFRPQVRFLNHRICYEEPVDVVIDRYEHYFRMFIELTPRKKKKIRHYFEALTHDGIVKTHETKAVAIMWWSVER